MKPNQKPMLFGGALALAACALGENDSEPPHDVGVRAEALALGRSLFEQPLPHTNGRACATCHVLDEGGTLRPANVQARAPDDALFARIDADDPDAAALAFEHLKKGLVRVVLPLPDNMDVIDAQGTVITNAARTIFVWRGVPAVQDTALTAPYQIDGREPTLEEQAQGAITNHSAGPNMPAHTLDRIAEFERSLFSSARARVVAHQLALGVPEERIPIPENSTRLTAAERRGHEVYERACAGCHGGVTTDRVTRPELAQLLVPALTPQGNVRFESRDDGPPAPVRLARPGSRFMNIGLGAATYFGQTGVAPAFNASVALPRYRFRFYTDSARCETRVDLPPIPVTASGDPLDPRAARDERGAPIVGPNLIPQLFTTDPGRAVITGEPSDFEAFDTPPLRGIARTAPYFHDNSAESLREVVDEYSRFVLSLLTPLGLPKLPPEQPGGRNESLSPEQKADLLAYLQKL